MRAKSITHRAHQLAGVSRRQWLQSATCGFGGLALYAMAARRSQAAGASLSHDSARLVGLPHHTPRAKRIIFLFMAGGPSQADLFDPKDLITRKHGQTVTAPVDDQQIRVGVEKFLAMAPIAPVRPRGSSGMMISDLMPNLATVADDLCLLRAMHTDNKAHAPATLQFHTGTLTEALPSMGSWISYGLGTENDNLPAFITIHPPGDVRNYGSAFLPAAHQGTPVSVPANERASAIKYLRDLDAEPGAQRRRLDFLQRMNQRLLDRTQTDAQMEGIINSFELALRMQAETPKLVDLSGETQETLDLYGVGD